MTGHRILPKTAIRTGRTALLVVAFAGVIATGSCDAQPAGATPKAVFIIADGIPADVLEGTATPALDEISAEGGYTRASVGGIVGTPSESPTISAVGYNSLLTGTWANKHNVWSNSIEDPDYGYWDVFRIVKAHDSTLRTAIFSTWADNRIKLLGDGLAAAGGSKLDYHFDGFELDTRRFPHDESGEYLKDIDALVAGEAARYIREEGPDLSWIYLEHTDSVGHLFGDGAEIAAAVGNMDTQIGVIWDAIKQRRQSHREDWLLLVTTDHGRDAATGKEHGGQSERERTSWIVTNSRRLNKRFDKLPAIVDIMPSIAAHLGLDIPEPVRRQLDGHSFIDERPGGEPGAM